jgi:hypothetical protein
MEATQAIRVTEAPKSKSSSTVARIHQDRRRKLALATGMLLVISCCIWIRPHALDSNILFWVIWSRPLALAYFIFGARLGYCSIANVPLRKEQKNPFAVQN